MKHAAGFTFIELILFIVITSIVAATILLAFNVVLLKTPTLQQQVIAAQTARQCMEWFIGQRELNGYSSLTCPSTPTPSFCVAPSGYTITNSITCTTLNGDANYKTISVIVGGLGAASLTTLIADY